MRDYKIGDLVVFVDADAHFEHPEFFPAVGSIGRVVEVVELDHDLLIVRFQDFELPHGLRCACLACRVKPAMESGICECGRFEKAVHEK